MRPLLLQHGRNLSPGRRSDAGLRLLLGERFHMQVLQRTVSALSCFPKSVLSVDVNGRDRNQMTSC